MKLITFSKFSKLLTSQPYFVWHDVETELEIDEDHLKFNLDSFKDIAGTSYSEIQAQSYAKLEKSFFEKAKKMFPQIKSLNNKKIEDKIVETNKLILDPNVEAIFQPIFHYWYKDYDAIARPEIYDKKNQILYFVKFSTSTKLKDILKMYFEYQVILKNNIDIKEIKLFIIATKDYKKGDVDFFVTNKINLTKSGRTFKDDKWDFVNKQVCVAGLGKNKDGDPFEKETIFEHLNNEVVHLPSDKVFQFKEFNFYLDKIIESHNIEIISDPIERDASIFADNKNWNYILEKTNNPWLGFSGHLVPKKSIIQEVSESQLIIESLTLQKILDNKTPVIDSKRLEKVNQCIEKLQKKVVWFDFEAFSLPYAPIDHMLPFSQVVSQVSIIITNNLEEIEVENKVFDTLNFSLDNFETIINSIYRQDHHFVVYNKGYEISRLYEMIHLLEKVSHPRIKDLQEKVSYIKDNIIDLLDFFRCSKKKIPIILIPELKGKYSIKFIEKYVSKHKKHLSNLIKEYKTLKVQNGMMAMEKANNRALGIIKDNQWLELQEDLKVYCENDVRAMILVFYLMKELVEEYNGQ